MAEKYVTVRTIHVQTEILETIEEARKAANAGNPEQSHALLTVAESYALLGRDNAGIAHLKELEVDSEDEA